MQSETRTRTTQPISVSIPEAVEITSVSRSVIYEEISRGALPARKLGRRTVILVDDLKRWLEGLPPRVPSDAA